MSDLPKEISRGVVQFGNLSIEVIQLDNGQRLISAESMDAFLAFLNADGFEMKGADKRRVIDDLYAALKLCLPIIDGESSVGQQIRAALNKAQGIASEVSSVGGPQ